MVSAGYTTNSIQSELSSCDIKLQHSVPPYRQPKALHRNRKRHVKNQSLGCSLSTKLYHKPTFYNDSVSNWLYILHILHWQCTFIFMKLVNGSNFHLFVWFFCLSYDINDLNRHNWHNRTHKITQTRTQTHKITQTVIIWSKSQVDRNHKLINTKINTAKRLMSLSVDVTAINCCHQTWSLWPIINQLSVLFHIKIDGNCQPDHVWCDCQLMWLSIDVNQTTFDCQKSTQNQNKFNTKINTNSYTKSTQKSHTKSHVQTRMQCIDTFAQIQQFLILIPSQTQWIFNCDGVVTVRPMRPLISLQSPQDYYSALFLDDNVVVVRGCWRLRWWLASVMCVWLILLGKLKHIFNENC